MEDIIPQIVNFQRPYPLILFDGYVYAQIGSLIRQIKDDEYASLPIIQGGEDFFQINGRIPVTHYDGEEEPVINLNIHENEQISWSKFLCAADSAIKHSSCSIGTLLLMLEDYNVLIKDIPKHINIYLGPVMAAIKESLFKEKREEDIINFQSPNFAFINNAVVYNSIEYEEEIMNLMSFKGVLPNTQFHVIYNHKDDKHKELILKVKEEIEECCSATKLSRVCEDLPDSDIINIAEKWHKINDSLPTREKAECSKDEILEMICKECHYDSQDKEWIWSVLMGNKLINPKKYCEIFNS